MNSQSTNGTNKFSLINYVQTERNFLSLGDFHKEFFLPFFSTLINDTPERDNVDVFIQLNGMSFRFFFFLSSSEVKKSLVDWFDHKTYLLCVY